MASSLPTGIGVKGSQPRSHFARNRYEKNWTRFENQGYSLSSCKVFIAIARGSILMTYCRLTRRVFNPKNLPFLSSSPMRFVIQHKSNRILTAMAHTGISDDSGIWHNIFSAKRHLVFPTERSCGSGTRSSGSGLGFPRKRYVWFCQDEWFALCECCYVSYFRSRLGMSV